MNIYLLICLYIKNNIVICSVLFNSNFKLSEMCYISKYITHPYLIKQVGA